MPTNCTSYSVSFLIILRPPVSFSILHFTLVTSPLSLVSSNTHGSLTRSASSGVSVMLSFSSASLSSPCWKRQRIYSLGVESRCCSMWWKACCATYATRALGCFHTVPVCGITSPVSSLIMVLLPTPLGPTHATRDDSDTCTVTSFTVGSGFTGYLYVHPIIFISGLPLDLTPSMYPGCGKRITNPVEDFSSKKLFALGFLATYAVRLPRNCLSLSVSMAMMLLHTRSSSPLSWLTMMHVTFLRLSRYSSTHFTFITSKWFVGSSISRMCALDSEMAVNTTRAFCPPDSFTMGVRWLCPGSPNLPSLARISSGL
mmetsp:Transcript_37333/g.92305  ORF Transcript_37333/g.92305 Transcript_37333/m.92305 type:complete len:314 (+) Transcript_37333:1165-2106(+)